MFKFVKALPLRSLLAEELPALAVSLLIAELFYKFHSFSLECLAFLATWYVIDLAITRLAGIWRARNLGTTHAQ